MIRDVESERLFSLFPVEMSVLLSCLFVDVGEHMLKPIQMFLSDDFKLLLLQQMDIIHL